MDLSRLLNENESTTTSNNRTPSLTRQHSMPLYSPVEHQLHPSPHSSYNPHVPEYFRDVSESVSPRTRHTSIPIEAGYGPIYRSNSIHSNRSSEPLNVTTTPSPLQASHRPYMPPPQSPIMKQRSMLPPTTPIILHNSPVTANRKRSLGSLSEAQQPVAKKIRVEPAPIWAKRTNWPPMGFMEKYVPMDFSKPRPKPKPKPKSKPEPVPELSTNQRAWESDLRSTREYSLDSHVPYNELHRTVATWLSTNILEPIPKDVGIIEIEARLGVLVDPNTRERFRLPIQSEVVLDHNSTAGLRFESLMDMVSFFFCHSI